MRAARLERVRVRFLRKRRRSRSGLWARICRRAKATRPPIPLRSRKRLRGPGRVLNPIMSATNPAP
jgi:hypothetical protein